MIFMKYQKKNRKQQLQYIKSDVLKRGIGILKNNIGMLKCNIGYTAKQYKLYCLQIEKHNIYNNNNIVIIVI